MDINDELIARKKAAHAAAASAKAKQEERSKAVDGLFKSIEDLLSRSVREDAIQLVRTPPVPPTGLPSLTIVQGSWRVNVKPEGHSRVEIEGGAVRGQKTVLTLNGSGEKLADWTIATVSTGKPTKRVIQPRAAAAPTTPTLTNEELQAALRQYLGLGK